MGPRNIPSAPLWCDRIMSVHSFQPSDQNDGLSLSALCFDCMYHTKNKRAPARILPESHALTHSQTDSLSLSLWGSVELCWLYIYFADTLRLWSLGKKKGSVGITRRLISLFVSLSFLFTTLLLTAHPCTDRMMHRQGLLGPSVAGISVHGLFSLLCFRYWFWYDFFLVLVRNPQKNFLNLARLCFVLCLFEVWICCLSFRWHAYRNLCF